MTILKHFVVEVVFSSKDPQQAGMCYLHISESHSRLP